MPYTRTSLLIVWLLLIGLIAAVVVLGPSRLGLATIVGAILVAPALLLRRSGPGAHAH